MEAIVIGQVRNDGFWQQRGGVLRCKDEGRQLQVELQVEKLVLLMGKIWCVSISNEAENFSPSNRYIEHLTYSHCIDMSLGTPLDLNMKKSNLREVE